MDYLSSIGLLTVLYLIAKIGYIIFIYFLRPSISYAKYKGTWAIVTGASWGIGSGFAKELAKEGINVVLIARTKERLTELAGELEQKYKIQTRTIAFDFATKDYKQYDTIAEQCKDLNITMLVNNVGMYYDHMKYFHEVSADQIDTICRVNIDSQNHMTRLFLPKLLDKKFGVVINISSESSVPNLPTGFFAVYAATKAYNDKLSRSLSDEYAGSGVEILSITPGFVTSKMTRSRNTNVVMCSEGVLARQTLNKVGYNYWSISPWFNHLIFTAVVSAFGNNILRGPRVSKCLQGRAKGFERAKEKKN